MPGPGALVRSAMSIPWVNILTTTGTVASAVAAGFALLSARRANQTAQAAYQTAETLAVIERHRWHADLTPEITAKFVDRLGQCTLRIALAGPVGLDRLDSVTVTMQNEGGVDHAGHSLPGGPSAEEVEAVVWSPYRFTPSSDGTDTRGRAPAPFPLERGQWRPFSIDVPPTPHWMQHDWWETYYADKPIRLTFECRRADHEPWIIPFEIPARTWNPAAPALDPGTQVADEGANA